MTSLHWAFDFQSAYVQLCATMQSERPLRNRLRETLDEHSGGSAIRLRLPNDTSN